MIQYYNRPSADLQSIPLSGQKIIFTNDTADLYIQKDNVRLQISDIIYVATRDDLPQSPLPKIYYTRSDKKLNVYVDNEWIILNDNSYGSRV